MKTLMKTLSGLTAGITLLTAGFAWAEGTAADNTAPVGQVCKAGEACAAAPVAAAGGGAKTGEQLYSSTCTMCHGAGVMNAPKFGDAEAWKPRLAAKGKDGLYKSALGGFNAMPPKGTCAACTDDEIKGAVDYMLSKAGL